jgi:hypothetical protein
MKCFNCIHYDVCNYHIDEETPILTVNECPHGFKHKDQYIQLPVFVGQDIWEVYQSAYSKQVTVTKSKVAMIQQKADKSWKFRVSRTGSVYDCQLSAIGDYIFLDEALANTKAEELRRSATE